MRFCRKRRPPVAPERHEPSEATIARMRAEVALEHTKAQTPFYRAIHDSLRDLRKENHLAQSFESAFRKGSTS